MRARGCDVTRQPDGDYVRPEQSFVSPRGYQKKRQSDVIVSRFSYSAHESARGTNCPAQPLSRGGRTILRHQAGSAHEVMRRRAKSQGVAVSIVAARSRLDAI